MEVRKNRSLKVKTLGCFVFCAVCSLLILFSIAAAEEDLSVSLSWTDAYGNVVSSAARRLEFDQEAWWVSVDADALDRLTLHISNPAFPSMRFSPADGSVLEGVADAGLEITAAPWIDIESADEYAGSVRLRLYISTMTDAPQDVPGTASSSFVNVYYRDETTYMEIMEGTLIECPVGSSVTVTAIDIPGYDLVSSAQVSVYADGSGPAVPSEVTFIYRRNAQAPSRTTRVEIKYLDESDGQRLMEDGFAECRFNDITTVPAMDIPGYSPLNASIDVITDPNGQTSPSQVVFYYRSEAGPTVTVHYIDLSGNPIRPDTYVECDTDSEKVIRAIQINGYTPEGPDTASVIVDSKGSADRYDVTFVYRRIEPVEVTVRFLRNVTGQEIASPETIVCPLGETTEISAREITGYILRGDALIPVTVGPNGETDAKEVAFYYDPVEAPIVTVSYLFEDGGHAAADDEIPCALGSTTTIPARNFPGYTVIGDPVQTVTADGNGNVQPDRIRFVYRLSAEPSVTVRFIESVNSTDIRTPETLVCAINASTPVQAPSISGYTITGQPTRYVYVDAQGKADTDEVVFIYDPETVPQVIWVRIVYRDFDGNELYSSTEPCDTGSTLTVAADPSKVSADYELSDSLQKTVTVTSQENAELTFWFRKKAVNRITIPVFYKDINGADVASAGIAELEEGNNAVHAQPIDLKPFYDLQGDPVQYVVMDETGQLSRSEVIFYYYLTITPTPAPTPTGIPFNVSQDPFYAHASKDGIYLRSSPSTASMDNVIRSVNKSEVIYVAGSLNNELGEKWYQVDIDGTGGFIYSNVIRAMDQEEINEYFHFTPTPVPTAIPDGAPIERWGRVNNVRVGFRKTSSKNGTLIDRLDKNTMVWVYKSVTVDGVQWYYIRSSGTDGYIMKEFVDLTEERENAEYQLSLKTPMTTRTPDPTRMATTEVTMTPIPTLTPEVYFTPEPTPAPAATPYYGYAVTKELSYVYAVPNDEEPYVISELGPYSVVLILENYGDWGRISQPDADEMNNMGYMRLSDLQPIANEDVARYRDSTLTIGTPTPVPTQVPPQRFGFARTVGNNIPLRAYPDTNAQIYLILSQDAVVSVNGQEFVNGQVWDQVNQGTLWGYIRDDQLRMMTDTEVVSYLETLRTPTPLPEEAPTPVPQDGNSLTSYGFVKSDKVNLRSAPSRSGAQIRMLDKYAFAIIYRTEVNEAGETWYYISQSGTEGYISGDHFEVLSVDKLAAFLTSEDYLNAANNTAQVSDVSVDNIQALEDYNRNVWQNPAVSVSYEPFAPVLRTPVAAKAASVTPTPTPTPAPRSTYGMGGIVGTPSTTVGSSEPPAVTEKKESGASALGFVLAAASLGLLGGGIYIYHIHRKNERRRRAVREQQARQAARMAARPRTTRAPGGYRPPESDNTRRVEAAPFMPPSGSPTASSKNSGASGETGVFRRPDSASAPPPFDMQGTRTYSAPKDIGAPAEENDPWRRTTITTPAPFSLRNEAPDESIPTETLRQFDDHYGSGTDLGSDGNTDAPPAPVRRRRSDRHRDLSGQEWHDDSQKP